MVWWGAVVCHSRLRPKRFAHNAATACSGASAGEAGPCPDPECGFCEPLRAADYPTEELVAVYPAPCNAEATTHDGFVGFVSVPESLPRRYDTRSTAHLHGLWHRTVHVWLVDAARGRVLLQRRPAAATVLPGRWNVSASGHVTCGEELVDTATRETAEELGVGVLPAQLHFLFTFAVTIPEHQPCGHGCSRRLHNEYVSAFAAHVDSEEVELDIDEEDVADARWFPTDTARRMLTRAGVENCVAWPLPYLEAAFSAIEHLPKAGEKGDRRADRTGVHAASRH